MINGLIKPSEQFQQEIQPALDDYLKDPCLNDWRKISQELSTIKLTGRSSIIKRTIDLALMEQGM